MTSRQTFLDWAEKYLDDFFRTKGLTGIDLYSARCGVLHTGQAPSKMVNSGDAHEVWWRLGGESHVNIMINTPKPAVLIDVEELIESFESGVQRFMTDVDADSNLQAQANAKAERFFHRGMRLGPL